jgi:hypothetical protein
MEEIMNYEEVMEPEVEIEETEGNSGMSTGVAILIGAGLTAAVAAAVKVGKNLWAKHKAKKELHLVEEGKTVEPTDEQIEEITK